MSNGPDNEPEEPMYFTGKTGEEHNRIAALGTDFLAILTGPEEWSVQPKPDDWDDCKKIIEAVEWSSFVIIRAMTQDDAEDACNDAEDQYESFINGDPDWMNIVLTPIDQREF